MSSQTTSGSISERVADAELGPFPVPAASVISGDPVATAKLLWVSADGTLCNGIWECTPGEFTWTHANETATVVSGRAIVTPEGGEPMTLEAGGVAFWPEGTTTHWQVQETIRKAFHLHAAGGLGL